MKELSRSVIDNSIRRSLKRSIAMIATAASDENTPMDEIMDYAEKQIISLRRGKRDGVTLGDILSVFLPRIEGMRNGTYRPIWAPKLTAMRSIIHYVEDTDLVVIGGRPGDGKSSYLRFELGHAALDGTPNVIFNYDNDPIDYARWMIALSTKIDTERLRDATRLTEEENEQIKRAAAQLAALPIYIESGHGNADWIKRTARSYIIEKGVKLIGVDYVQLIRNSEDNSRNDDVAATMATLREINQTLKIPILAASQLNRDIERRGQGQGPMMADLRDSGSLEQDATVIVFPRTVWTDPSQAEIASYPENIIPATRRPYSQLKAVPIKFHVVKNRNGAVGTSEPVKWIKSTGDYQTVYQGQA